MNQPQRKNVMRPWTGWVGCRLYLTCDEPAAEEECDETLDGVGGLQVISDLWWTSRRGRMWWDSWLGMSTFRFFCERTFRFFGPLEKKCISFRFWIQRKAKICLLFINKKFVFISKRFIIFYSLKRTKYSLIFY